MMITPGTYTPPIRYAAARPTGAAPMKPALKFGACVEAKLARAEAQKWLMANNSSDRIHALAEMGMKGQEEVVDELADFLLKQGKYQGRMNANQEYSFSIGSLLELSKRHPGKRALVLKALQEALENLKAGKARHLRPLQNLIKEAIDEVAHNHKKKSKAVQQVQAEMARNRNHQH